ALGNVRFDDEAQAVDRVALRALQTILHHADHIRSPTVVLAGGKPLSENGGLAKLAVENRVEIDAELLPIFAASGRDVAATRRLGLQHDRRRPRQRKL